MRTRTRTAKSTTTTKQRTKLCGKSRRSSQTSKPKSLACHPPQPRSRRQLPPQPQPCRRPLHQQQRQQQRQHSLRTPNLPRLPQVCVWSTCLAHQFELQVRALLRLPPMLNATRASCVARTQTASCMPQRKRRRKLSKPCLRRQKFRRRGLGTRYAPGCVVCMCCVRASRSVAQSAAVGTGVRAGRPRCGQCGPEPPLYTLFCAGVLCERLGETQNYERTTVQRVAPRGREEKVLEHLEAAAGQRRARGAPRGIAAK